MKAIRHELQLVGGYETCRAGVWGEEAFDIYRFTFLTFIYRIQFFIPVAIYLGGSGGGLQWILLRDRG